MDASSDGPDGSLVVGPLLVASLLAWALWGILSLQFYLFAIASPLSPRSSISTVTHPKEEVSGEGGSGSALGFARARGHTTGFKPHETDVEYDNDNRNANTHARARRRPLKARGGENNAEERLAMHRLHRLSATDAAGDINPWTLSVAYSPTPPTPTLSRPHSQPQLQSQSHERFSSSNSYEHYASSPTAAEDSFSYTQHQNQSTFVPPLNLRRAPRHQHQQDSASSGIPGGTGHGNARSKSSRVHIQVDSVPTPTSSSSHLSHPHLHSHQKPSSSTAHPTPESGSALFSFFRHVEHTFRAQFFNRTVLSLYFYVLYAVVCAQVGFATVYVWNVVLGGWRAGASTDGSSGSLRVKRDGVTAWSGVVANDVLGPIVFVLSMLFYAQRLCTPSVPASRFRSSRFRSQSESEFESESECEVTSTSAPAPLTAPAMGRPKLKLRPLSLVKSQSQPQAQAQAQAQLHNTRTTQLRPQLSSTQSPHPHANVAPTSSGAGVGSSTTVGGGSYSFDIDYSVNPYHLDPPYSYLASASAYPAYAGKVIPAPPAGLNYNSVSGSASGNVYSANNYYTGNNGTNANGGYNYGSDTSNYNHNYTNFNAKINATQPSAAFTPYPAFPSAAAGADNAASNKNNNSSSGRRKTVDITHSRSSDLNPYVSFDLGSVQGVGTGGGGGNVQPIPSSRWERVARALKRVLPSSLGSHLSSYPGSLEGDAGVYGHRYGYEYGYGERDGVWKVKGWRGFGGFGSKVGAGRTGARVGGKRGGWILNVVLPLVIASASAVIGVCGLVHAGKMLNANPPIGSPPAFDGPTVVWLVGNVVLDLAVCGVLLRPMITSRTFNSTHMPWFGRVMRVFCEAGIAQFLVAVLALVLVCYYHNRATLTTIPLVPLLLLPSLYANTVFLNASESYTPASLLRGPTPPRRRPSLPNTTPVSASSTSGFGKLKASFPFPAEKEKDKERDKEKEKDKDKEKAKVKDKDGDIEMRIRNAFGIGNGSIRRSRSRVGFGISSGSGSGATQRVIRFSGSGFGTTSGSGSGTGTGTGTNTSTGTSHSNNSNANGEGAVRTAAAGYDAERQEGGLSRSASGGAARLHLERDTLGEGSSAKLKGVVAGSGSGSGTDRVADGSANPAGGSGGGGVGSAGNHAKRSSISGMSSVSQGALSLELPVFRKGKGARYRYGYGGYGDGHYWGDWDDDDDDDGEDGESFESSLDDEVVGGGGTWDYGYSLNVTMMEREKEREERERATNAANGNATTPSVAAALTSGTTTGGGTNGVGANTLAGAVAGARRRHSQSMRNSYPSFSLSRHASWRQSTRSPRLRQRDESESIIDSGAEDDEDVLSVLSSTNSRRSRSLTRPHHHHSHRPNPNHHHLPLQQQLALRSHAQYQLEHPLASPRSPNSGLAPARGQGRGRRLLPPTPDDTSIMIISAQQEPSIVEPSVYKAASVAATRASTGSMWSSYTYPKPMAFPDLDEDLQDGMFGGAESDTGGFYYDPGAAMRGGDAGDSVHALVKSGDAGGDTDGDVDAVRVEDGLGANVEAGDRSGGGGGGVRNLSAHPYATAGASVGDSANEEEERIREEERRKRRWRVHPLKRMVEMGRFMR